jgi:hypothetical protein
MLKRNNLFKRGLLYESLMFLYAGIVTWLIFGSPLKSLFLAAVVTVSKFPLYVIFHQLAEQGKLRR